MFAGTIQSLVHYYLNVDSFVKSDRVPVLPVLGPNKIRGLCQVGRRHKTFSQTHLNTNVESLC